MCSIGVVNTLTNGVDSVKWQKGGTIIKTLEKSIKKKRGGSYCCSGESKCLNAFSLSLSAPNNAKACHAVAVAHK